MDHDIKELTLEQSQTKLQEWRDLIRWWSDQRGDDRCWLDDIKIMKAILPHGTVDFKLPCWEKFGPSCKKFWETRQEPGKEDQLHAW